MGINGIEHLIGDGQTIEGEAVERKESPAEKAIRLVENYIKDLASPLRELADSDVISIVSFHEGVGSWLAFVADSSDSSMYTVDYSEQSKTTRVTHMKIVGGVAIPDMA